MIIMNDELLNVLFKTDEDMLSQAIRMLDDSTKRLSDNELNYLLSSGRITIGVYNHLTARRKIFPELYLIINK